MGGGAEDSQLENTADALGGVSCDAFMMFPPSRWIVRQFIVIYLEAS
jgi:hypothetical protein